MRPALLATKEVNLPYLGQKPLSETAPNHPFSRMQISFGVPRPANSAPPSRTDLTDILYHRHRETIASRRPDPEVAGLG